MLKLLSKFGEYFSFLFNVIEFHKMQNRAKLNKLNQLHAEENNDEVCFLCKDEKLIAQKYVLAATSPVFEAMFLGPMKESGDIVVKDASPDVFKVFLDLFNGKN